LNSQNELRTGAVQAAQIVTESWRMVDPTTMPSSGNSAPQTIQVGDHSYDVVTSFCSAPSLCDADSRHLIVNVQQGGQDLYATETVYTNFR